MDKWVTLVKDMITLAMFILAFYGVLWKALDAWEKRKSAPIKPLETRIEKLERENGYVREEIVSIKAKAAEMLTITLTYFKK